MNRPTFTVTCDDWTFHTLKLFLRGPQPRELIQAITASPLQPKVQRCQLPDPNSGRRFTWGYTLTMHFSSPNTTRLLTLGEISARLETSLEYFPWLLLPNLSVSRLDLASDHLVSAPPGQVCDLISRVNLPHSQRIAKYGEGGDPYNTVYHVSGRRSLDPIPFGEHHRKGKQPVVVAHYPRLNALLARPGEGRVPAAAVEYTQGRTRQEVRFRREAIRGHIGPGSATVGEVLGAFPAFVRAAGRRLRPIVEDAGILSLPRLDLEGEETLLPLISKLP